MIWTGENSTFSKVNCSDSILDKSRTSLMIWSKWRAACWILASCSRGLGALISWLNRWVKPRIAFIGVRISWLILAKKMPLARLAASAAFLASSSAARWLSLSRQSRRLRANLAKIGGNRTLARSTAVFRVTLENSKTWPMSGKTRLSA